MLIELTDKLGESAGYPGTCHLETKPVKHDTQISIVLNLLILETNPS